MQVKKLRNNPGIIYIFRSLKQRPYAFWLDSARDFKGQGRYSFMGCDPFLIFKSYGTCIELSTENHQQMIRGNPFDLLQQLMQKYRLPKKIGSLPFNGGAVGYFGYDLGRQLEVIP